MPNFLLFQLPDALEKIFKSYLIILLKTGTKKFRQDVYQTWGLALHPNSHTGVGYLL